MEKQVKSLQWYHVILSTYGSWLYGDPRGFRTRHHREHVEGDYKNPPPQGRYAERERRSRESLKCDPICLPESLRPIVGAAIRDRLEQLGHSSCVSALAASTYTFW